MSTHNLQHALATAAAEVREAHPELTAQDVLRAYTAYQQHFGQQENEPPVSDLPAIDALLLALWDVIVDRETAGADDEAEGELEAYYAAAFTELQQQPVEEDETSEPIALTNPVDEHCEGPAPVVVENDEPVELPDLVKTTDNLQSVIYSLKVTLDDGNPSPRIWRKLLVPAEVRQTELHHILQAVMGWRGTEEFQFFPPQQLELPSTGEPELKDLLTTEGQDCGYEFDNWYHNVSLVEKTYASPDHHYPECTGGRGACPPEDMGGMTEYKRMLDALKDPGSPDYEEMAGWITQDFNPDAFSVEQANTRLGQSGDNRFYAVV